jgi:hypothetical protein
MTLRHRSLRTVAAGSVLGLAASAAAVLGTTTSASAVEFDVTCQTALGEQTFAIDVTTDAPAELPSGASHTPKVTAVLTVPAGMADALRGFLGAEEVEGTIVAQAVVNGTPLPVPLAIPRTDVGEAGTPAIVTATGQSPIPLTAGTPGRYNLAAGDMEVDLTVYNAQGEATPVNDIMCTPGEPVPIGTVDTVKADSTTDATSKVKKKKVTITAAVTTETGIPADGSVKISLEGKKSGQGANVQVEDGVAKATFKVKPGKYDFVAKYKGSEVTEASKDKGSVKVG